MSKPNILVLVFDTLRPDYLSAYDSKLPYTTRSFEKLAEEGVLFERAFSVGPNTEISHGALFTGQYPSETGIIGGDVSIQEDIPLLAEHIRKLGYNTFGISGPSKIRSDLGYDRGFDTYFEPYYEDVQPRPSKDYFKNVLSDPVIFQDFVRTIVKGTDSLTELRFKWLEEEICETETPFFGFVNFLTCHSPYNPPRPYKEEILTSIKRPKLFLTEWILSILGYQAESIMDQDIRGDRVLRAANGDGGPFFGDSDWLSKDEIKTIRKLYTASVRYLDDQLSSFLRWFETSSIMDETILILTADHGEHLGEHRLLYHANSLYDENLHVPLIIKGPNLPSGKRRQDLVSLIDIFPTVCDSANVSIPSEISGISLFEDKRDEVFAEIGKRDPSLSKFSDFFSDDRLEEFTLGEKCIRTSDKKLMLKWDETINIYDVPGEDLIRTINVDDDREGVNCELYKNLITTLGGDFGDIMSYNPNEQVLSNLRKLGYLS